MSPNLFNQTGKPSLDSLHLNIGAPVFMFSVSFQRYTQYSRWGMIEIPVTTLVKKLKTDVPVTTLVKIQMHVSDDWLF